MEALQHNPSIVFGQADLPRPVLGSWTKEEQGEGVECSLCSLNEFEGTVASLRNLEVDQLQELKTATFWVNELENYDLTDEAPTKKEKMGHLFRVVRRVFPRRSGSTKKHVVVGSKKSKTATASDDSSIPSTVAESVCDSDLEESTSIKAEKICRGMSSDSPLLLGLLRVLVEYESEKYVSSQAEFEIIIPDICHQAKALDPEESTPLMQKRLFKMGIVTSTDDFKFAPDFVSKVIGIPKEEKQRALHEENVTHVKTGIWEVSVFDDDGNLQSPFYVVTGVSMEDRVDTKKLRKAVFAGQSYKKRPKLSMAETKIAEGLAGYKSGTMAPICHSVDMQLYLEESIIANNNHSPAYHTLKCGSGMFGKCLSISADKFLEIAKVNPKGMKACPIIQKKKK
jgi:prolyl-tRNA editing enzyme YbaK/EbsC (Cys-tRNA(Pro) deacylase)